MLIVTEAKAQGWRAVAILEGLGEALLYVGRSSTQVRGGYGEAFHGVLTEEEISLVKSIKIQQWQGAPDAGSWEDKGELRLPVAPTSTSKATKIAA
jgi:hypothetical protein